MHLGVTSERSWGTIVRVHTSTLDKRLLNEQITVGHGLLGFTSTFRIMYFRVGNFRGKGELDIQVRGNKLRVLFA